MVIDDDEDDAGAAGDDVAGAAYKETLISADGFTRGANGRVKFHKDTKKRRRTNGGGGDDEDVEMADMEALGQSQSNKKRRKKEMKLGHEFKAKVSRLLRQGPDLALIVRTECWWRCQERGHGSLCILATLAGSKEKKGRQ